MGWRGRLGVSGWGGNVRRYSHWQGRRGDALTDPVSVVSYGYLYNWAAVNKAVAEGDGYSLAPTGWHVPTDAELTTLVDYVGSDAGRKLKSERTATGSPNVGIPTNAHPRWNYHATNFGLDEFGFAAIPGGYRDTDGSFGSIGSLGYWWSSTEDASTNACVQRMRSFDSNVIRQIHSKTLGFSVRLIRDNDTNWTEGETVEIDGYTYDTVKIGNQVWMVQNLATTKYRNGEDIPNVTGNTAWSEDTAGARCAYGNDEDNVFATFEWL